MKIKLFISAGLLMIISMLFMPGVKGVQTRAYYMGDAIIYNGQVVIGSVNMGGGLELLKLEANKLVRAANIKLFKTPYTSAGEFYDFAFSAEQDKLFVYLVDGRYLYKYDISNLSSPALASQVKDNAWDYFMGVDRRDDKILTFGIKGIKVWNLVGQIVDSYNITNKLTYNINFQSGNYIFDANTDRLKIYDKTTRQFVKEILFTMNENVNRKTFVDQINNAVYLVDDGSLKKFDYSGNMKNVFKHISNLGYDVDGLADKDHLYFTDGKGIVQFAKDSLKPLKWAYTTNLGEDNGWAMGLKVLKDGDTEKIVIFNNSSILVLDENLKMISHIAATAAEIQPQENLFLNLDSNRAAAGSLVALQGGGYAAGEELAITFAGQNYSATAGSNGRFIKTITVPSVVAGKADIKVTGKSSGLNYSIGFKIE